MKVLAEQIASIIWIQSTSSDWSNLIFNGSPFPKNIKFWYKVFKNIIALFITLLLTLCKQKLVDNMPTINVWISLRNVILMDFGAKWSKNRFMNLKTDWGLNNRPINAQMVAKEAYWIDLLYSNRVYTKIFDILGTVGLQKSGCFNVL